MFKVTNENTRTICEIYSELTIKTPEDVTDVVLVFLSLTLNTCHTLIWYFHCLIWTNPLEFDQVLPTEPGNSFRYFEQARIWKRDWKKRMKIYIKCCWQLTLEITLEDTLYCKRVYVQPFLRHLGHVTWKRSRSNIFPHCFKKWYKPTNNFFKRQGYFKRQSHKMVKHTQTICRHKRANCLSVFDLFVGWHLKG